MSGGRKHTRARARRPLARRAARAQGAKPDYLYLLQRMCMDNPEAAVGLAKSVARQPGPPIELNTLADVFLQRNMVRPARRKVEDFLKLLKPRCCCVDCISTTRGLPGVHTKTGRHGPCLASQLDRVRVTYPIPTRRRGCARPARSARRPPSCWTCSRATCPSRTSCRPRRAPKPKPNLPARPCARLPAPRPALACCVPVATPADGCSCAPCMHEHKRLFGSHAAEILGFCGRAAAGNQPGHQPPGARPRPARRGGARVQSWGAVWCCEPHGTGQLPACLRDLRWRSEVAAMRARQLLGHTLCKIDGSEVPVTACLHPHNPTEREASRPFPASLCSWGPAP